MNYANKFFEAIKPVKSGILVCDIDDTLIRADSSVIKVYKINKETGEEIGLSTSEYAYDPDIESKNPKFEVSYREFNDPEKVTQSILQGTPMLRNLRLLDAHVRANYDVCFLTARGLRDVIDETLTQFLRYRDDNGELQELGEKFKHTLSVAVNDKEFIKVYPNMTDYAKKAMILEQLCGQYENVKFIDDDPKNIRAAREMAKEKGLDNLQCIVANKDANLPERYTSGNETVDKFINECCCSGAVGGGVSKGGPSTTSGAFSAFAPQHIVGLSKREKKKIDEALLGFDRRIQESAIPFLNFIKEHFGIERQDLKNLSKKERDELQKEYLEYVISVEA